MEIKLFEKYLQLCRKHGVESLKIGEIEVKLSQEPPKSKYKQAKENKESTSIQSSPQFSNEEILMWSSGGIPAMNEESNA